MKRVPTLAKGPKDQSRRPHRVARAVGTPLSIPAIRHPGVKPPSDIPLPEGVPMGMNYTITEGPTVATVTKGVPKHLFFKE